MYVAIRLGQTDWRCKNHALAFPVKTISGTVGGILSATAIAALMAPITPFSHGQAAVIGFIVCLMGFFGGWLCLPSNAITVSKTGAI